MTEPISSLVVGRSAWISTDDLYRYQLTRQLKPNPNVSTIGMTVTFVGLNPSIADATVDDPTVRRCIGYAYDWGFTLLHMVNLFAKRATNPRKLRSGASAIGEHNDDCIHSCCKNSHLVVAAWGADPFAPARASRVISDGLLGDYAVLGLTRDGQPRHPLYMSKTAVPFDPRTREPVALPARVGVHPL
jgi:hypothetical protein